MMSYPIGVDKDVFALLSELLTTGKVVRDGKSIDLSPVQTITISNGKMVFKPAAKVAIQVSRFLKLNTTLSSISLNSADNSKIDIEIDNSPVDLELRPK